MSQTETTALPLMQDETWVLQAANPEQRDELLRYADKAGVPCWSMNVMAEDDETDLGWFGDLMAYTSIGKSAMRKVSITEFKAMCAAYTA